MSSETDISGKSDVQFPNRASYKYCSFCSGFVPRNEYNTYKHGIRSGECMRNHSVVVSPKKGATVVTDFFCKSKGCKGKIVYPEYPAVPNKSTQGTCSECKFNPKRQKRQYTYGFCEECVKFYQMHEMGRHKTSKKHLDSLRRLGKTNSSNSPQPPLSPTVIEESNELMNSLPPPNSSQTDGLDFSSRKDSFRRISLGMYNLKDENSLPLLPNDFDDGWVNSIFKDSRSRPPSISSQAPRFRSSVDSVGSLNLERFDSLSKLFLDNSSSISPPLSVDAKGVVPTYNFTSHQRKSGGLSRYDSLSFLLNDKISPTSNNNNNNNTAETPFRFGGNYIKDLDRLSGRLEFLDILDGNNSNSNDYMAGTTYASPDNRIQSKGTARSSKHNGTSSSPVMTIENDSMMDAALYSDIHTIEGGLSSNDPQSVTSFLGTRRRSRNLSTSSLQQLRKRHRTASNPFLDKSILESVPSPQS